MWHGETATELFSGVVLMAIADMHLPGHSMHDPRNRRVSSLPYLGRKQVWILQVHHDGPEGKKHGNREW
jgi:hypothetical protein